MTPKAISFTLEVLKAKLRALEEYGRCMTRRPVRPQPPSGNGTERWTFCVSSTDKRDVDRFMLAQVDPSGRLYTERGREAVLANVKPPLGLSGFSLWIRERARVLAYDGLGRGRVRLRYEVDGAESDWIEVPERIVTCEPGRCIANGVFREGARHFLEVVEVRAERVADISEDDAVLEGISPDTFDGPVGDIVLRNAYLALYDSIYGHGAHARDWCWVYTLKRAAL